MRASARAGARNSADASATRPSIGKCGGANAAKRAAGCGSAEEECARREPRAERFRVPVSRGNARAMETGGKTPAKAQSATRVRPPPVASDAPAERRRTRGEDAITGGRERPGPREGFFNDVVSKHNISKALSTIVTVNRCCARLGSTRRELVGLARTRLVGLCFVNSSLRYAPGSFRRAIESKPPLALAQKQMVSSMDPSAMLSLSSFLAFSERVLLRVLPRRSSPAAPCGERVLLHDRLLVPVRQLLELQHHLLVRVAMLAEVLQAQPLGPLVLVQVENIFSSSSFCGTRC